MDKGGVMEQIRELLAQGKTSRELIDLGYRPGSVYGALRKLRHQEDSENEDGYAPSRDAVQQGASVMAEDEDCLPIWHIHPPVDCPGCGEPVVHWLVCRFCGKVFPGDCNCPKNSPSLVHGYTMSELFHGAIS